MSYIHAHTYRTIEEDTAREARHEEAICRINSLYIFIMVKMIRKKKLREAETKALRTAEAQRRSQESIGFLIA